MNSIKKRMSYLLAMVFVILALTGCTNKTAIVGQWRQQGQSDILLEAYDDGTCVISGEYGLGTWELSSGNRLRLSNIYGETQVFSIKKLTNSKMVIDDSGDEITLEKVPGTGSKAAEAPKYFAILAVIVIVLIFIGWLARSKQKRKANQSQVTTQPGRTAPVNNPAPGTTIPVSRKQCPTCGNMVEEGHKFCPHCGAEMRDVQPAAPKPKYCPGCGEPVKEGAKFCGKCGTKL